MLTALKHYTTFLAIVERACLTLLLKRATLDSAESTVDFIEDSVNAQFGSIDSTGTHANDREVDSP